MSTTLSLHKHVQGQGSPVAQGVIPGLGDGSPLLDWQSQHSEDTQGDLAVQKTVCQAVQFANESLNLCRAKHHKKRVLGHFDGAASYQTILKSQKLKSNRNSRTYLSQPNYTRLSSKIRAKTIQRTEELNWLKIR